MIPKSHEDFQLAEQDIHQAREVCPFLGGMAVEQANMWLEMAQKGKAMMEAEQTEPIKQPEPEESTIDIQKPLAVEAEQVSLEEVNNDIIHPAILERDDAQIPDEQLLVAEETQPVRIEVKIIDSASEDKAKIMEPIIHEIHDSDAAVVDLQETSVQTITSEKPLVVSDLADNKLDIVNGIESNSEDVLTENVHTIQVMTEESDPNVDFYPEETVNELVGAEVSEETIATIVQPESINQGTPSEEHPAIIYEQSEKQVIDEQFSTEQVDTEQSFIEPQLEVHDPVPQLQEVEVLSAPDVLEAPESDVEHVEEHSVETIFYQRPVETIQLLQVIESKISESEPEKFIEVESIMDRLGEVLSQTETPVETDELSMQDKSEVTELFIELCDVLGIVPEESSIKQLAEVLLQRQELVKELIAQKPHLYEKGTHEVINHLSKLLGLIKNVLEPIHLAIGRFVVASQRQLQPALI